MPLRRRKTRLKKSFGNSSLRSKKKGEKLTLLQMRKVQSFFPPLLILLLSFVYLDILSFFMFAAFLEGYVAQLAEEMQKETAKMVEVKQQFQEQAASPARRHVANSNLF